MWSWLPSPRLRSRPWNGSTYTRRWLTAASISPKRPGDWECTDVRLRASSKNAKSNSRLPAFQATMEGKGQGFRSMPFRVDNGSHHHSGPSGAWHWQLKGKRPSFDLDTSLLDDLAPAVVFSTDVFSKIFRRLAGKHHVAKVCQPLLNFLPRKPFD